MDKDIARRALNKFSKALTGRHWWLEAGTCLGAFREHDFIGHDHDLDIGILFEDFDWEIVRRLVYRGFTIKHVFGMWSKGLEIAFDWKGVKIDLFVFYKKDNKRWHAAWRNGSRNGMEDMIKLVFDAELVEDLLPVNFQGTRCYIPKETERYLIARYGEDWKIPNKHWDWATDPKCIDPSFEV